MRRAVTPRDVVDGLKLRRTVASLGRLDVLHSHSSKAGALARTFCLGLAKAQVYSPHGFYTMTGEAPFYVAPVERALSLVTDKIIAVSNVEAEHAVAIGIERSKVEVIANGIEAYEPLRRSEAREQLGLPEDVFVIGFVGRLSAQKGPDQAVAVLRALGGADRAVLAIIGDGELRPEVEALAANSGYVLLAGGRPARPLYPAFDCLLCTSRYEGMPVTFLEALNCGVPIVTYPVGGSEELVADPAAGFVTAADPVSAAQAVRAIMHMGKKERSELSRRCLGAARAHSAERMTQQTLDLYARLLSSQAV
jgi:glycosyltransferase involved in cell wall biosynthesis